MRQMSGFRSSVASGDGERAGNHSWSQRVGRGQGAQSCRHRQAQGSAHARAPTALPSQQQINGYKQTPASAHTKWLCEKGAGKAPVGCFPDDAQAQQCSEPQQGWQLLQEGCN